jgi:hypothetical protein
MEDTPRGVDGETVLAQSQGWVSLLQKASEVRGYISLCQRREIASVRGQLIARPEADLRCEVCDGLEMARRGWDASGPVSLRRVGGLSR